MADALAALLARLGSPRIVVAGDLMVDAYREGTVRRISPEAPIPVFEEGGETLRLGGAANVASNVSALGARAAILGLAGIDAEGDFLVRESRRRGINASGVVRVEKRPTTRKTRLVADDRQVLRLDREVRDPAPPSSARRFLAAARRVLKGAKVLLVSDYAKGALPPPMLSRLFALARAAGAESWVDPKGRDLKRYRGADGLKCNRAEAFALAGMEQGGVSALEAAGRAILKRGGFSTVLVTRKEGIAVFEKGRPAVHVPGHEVSVFDVSGAGDTVHAAIGLGRASGLSALDCATLANAAASIAVGRPGVVAVSREDLRSLARASSGSAGKVLDRRDLAVALDQHRARGQAVVFTNGCFDLLHPGHLATIRFAKSKGDILVVGINSDASVRRLKGPTRPVLPEAARAAMLAALSDVDYVTVFPEDTPSAVIRRSRPDVLVKGSDWRTAGVVGRGFVESRGGKVVLAPIVPGLSTTAILERAKRG
ncbi:MAG: PfkB family carbohydrate kinase [Planctomycetota bacterium]